MRLIDERDVINRLETVYGLRGAVKEEALCAVDMCKTVPAIPVEWLMDFANRGDFVQNAVIRWQFEQEKLGIKPTKGDTCSD